MDVFVFLEKGTNEKGTGARKTNVVSFCRSRRAAKGVRFACFFCEDVYL
jgi:hypothetical protein